MKKEIKVHGAKVHNLKDVDVSFPRNKLVVFTGVSGSGKSSLAFDTIYAEGQRRYIESLSAYARQFLDQLDKPDVESIDGLSPAISIDQKSGSKNPRSTVGTVTEIYDYFRLLFSSIGKAHCPSCKKAIETITIQEMKEQLNTWPEDTAVTIFAPLIDNKKGEFKDLFEDLLKHGFRRVRVNGEIKRLDEKITLNKQKKHTISLVVDRLKINTENESRLFQSLETASQQSDGLVLVESEDKSQLFSEKFSCPGCSVSIKEISPRFFSFNSPIGACKTCNGLGEYRDFDPDLLITNHFIPMKSAACKLITLNRTQLGTEANAVLKPYNCSVSECYDSLNKTQQNVLFYGVEKIDRELYSSQNDTLNNKIWDGLIPLLRHKYNRTYSEARRFYYRSFMSSRKCTACKGARLNQEALHVTVGKKSIGQYCDLPLNQLLEQIETLKLTKKEADIVKQVKKEIVSRLSFLNNVGLGYLSLSRQAGTLSGGEFQRIRLATQIGSALTGVLYVLDEPSIGLHQKDNEKLIETLQSLRDLGNSLIVVEHDDATILKADHVIEIGPKAGIHGGEIVFSGSQKQFMKSNCLTAQYVTGKQCIEVPKLRRKSPAKKALSLTGVSENNLKNVSVTFPLSNLICITGVSGSGKSTLVYEVLHKALMRHFYQSKERPGKYKSLKGLEHIDKVITIDQSPIGRTPRSNPSTYVGVFSPIRDLFTKAPESKIRGYKAGRFSFNVKGGRCEACEGDGQTKIEMHFLSDVYVQCEVCKGKRYNTETLEVKYKGLSISDVLELSINQACELFEAIPAIYNKLKTLQDVGLGYIRLGQSATTLSGGEAQRVKLAKELSKRSTGKTLYLLDEPTTGLHFEDIKQLLSVLDRLVDAGNTVIVIEHNLDVIKTADHIIDVGPDGGAGGGEIIATGTPEQVAKNEASHTGRFLKELL